MRRSGTMAWIVAFAGIVLPAASAFAVTDSQLNSTVMVYCDDRQGSGAVTGPNAAFVVTNGHIAIDPATKAVASTCTVGFPDAKGEAKTYSHASVERAVFDERKERDFAILRIGERFAGPPAVPASAIPFDPFRTGSYPVTVVGYPSGGPRTGSAGTVKGYARGLIETDTRISEGDSGGPAFAGDAVVGVATKVRYTIDRATGEKTDFSYELGDVLPLMEWLATFGTRAYEQYLTFAEPERVRATPYFARREEGPGCLATVRTALSSTVYCIMTGERRMVFPDARVFLSWYPDFSGVQYAATEDIAQFALVGNMTHRPGTLVKITTDPRVYLVTDAIGTLRWLPSEGRAAELFGSGWASLVRDVPDEYFVNYSVSQPVE